MKLFRRFQKESHPFCTVIVVAAGSAQRMLGVDKIMAELGGEPVILRSLRTISECEQIDEIIVVTREDLIEPIGLLRQEANLTKVKKIVLGGTDRALSVLNGVQEADKRATIIAVHDGARPFASPELVASVIEEACRSGAAAPAIPVTDTIKIAENGAVTKTPDRSALFAVQTPQAFDADLLKGALHYCISRHVPITDDCSAVEQLGKQVVLTQGSAQNIKITTPFDLVLGEAILAWQAAE